MADGSSESPRHQETVDGPSELPVQGKRHVDDVDESSNLPTCTSRLLESAQELWAYLVTSANALGLLVSAAPKVVIIPLLMLLSIVVACEVALQVSAVDVQNQRQEIAVAISASTVTDVGTQFQNLVSPAIALTATINAQPHVPSYLQQFRHIARKIFKKSSGMERAALFVAPYNIVFAAASGAFATANKPRDSMFINVTEYLDYFSSGYQCGVQREGLDTATVAGPITEEGDLLDHFVVSLVVFIPDVALNETFGMDTSFPSPEFPDLMLGNMSTAPPTTICGTSTETRTADGLPFVFWGVVGSVLPSNQFESRLTVLASQQNLPYKYVVFQSLIRTPSEIASASLRTVAIDFAEVAENKVLWSSEGVITISDNPICSQVSMQILGVSWTLCIAPTNGWMPDWLRPLQIAVPFIAAFISGLMFCLLVTHQRHTQLVRLMLPKQVVKSLNTGRTYAQPFKQVTILFSDIVSYTNLSSELTPPQLVELLNDLYSHFDSLVDKHKLYKVETIGDAFMCVGGAPETCDPQDAAIRSARMALDMVDFASKYVLRDGRKLQIRIGLFTGDVTAAVIGKAMPHWCLVGDAVNTASRMETNSLPMHVHVGATTAMHLSASPTQEFYIQPRGKIQIKGKGPMNTYFVWPRHQVGQVALTLAKELSSGPSDTSITSFTVGVLASRGPSGIMAMEASLEPDQNPDLHLASSVL